MIVDADWNEQSDIFDYRQVSTLADVVASGAPVSGGLALIGTAAAPLLRPGRVYVEGVAAVLPAQAEAPAGIPPASQADYPNPPALPAGNLRFYVDVWERTVTALEDGELMDAGLHGADTASRTQTLLQVKWCDLGVDIANPNINPQQGNAPLSLTLRAIASSGDPCDPCAAEAEVDERIGNYLFRVEVHEVFQLTNQTHIALKWSRDNGAEAYTADQVPAGFGQGNWIWEFYDAASEKQLGRHFPATFRPRVGMLKKTFDIPTGTDPKAFVRQWDGYAIINLATSALVEGRDRGADLHTTGNDDSAGKVLFAAGKVKINLDLLVLELELAGKQFLAGDHWLGMVREAVRKSGDIILDRGLPVGVRHRYLEIGTRTGSALAPPTGLTADAWRRRMAFPPLTALQAGDVAYTPPAGCQGLYGPDAVENVKQALDKICAIDALDIGFDLKNPLPPNSVAALLASQLGANWPNLDTLPKNPSVNDMLWALLYNANAAALPYTIPACANTPNTLAKLLGLVAGPGQVGSTLDKLLCTLDADKIPLGSPVCQDLINSGATTVLDALDYLCGTRITRCATTVPVGNLKTELQAFAATANITDLWLCLMPGEHIVDVPITITGKRSLRISAAAAGASTVYFTNQPASFSAQEIGIEGVRLRFASSASITLTGNRVVGNRNIFVRASSSETLPPMVRVDPLGAGSELIWRDNVMQDTWSHPATHTVTFVGQDIIGNKAVTARFKNILEDKTLIEDDIRFEKELDLLTEEIAGMTGRERLAWRTRMDQISEKENQKLTGIDKLAPKATAKTTAKKTSKAAKANTDATTSVPLAAGDAALKADTTVKADISDLKTMARAPIVHALPGNSVGLLGKASLGALTVTEAKPMAAKIIDDINAAGADKFVIREALRDFVVILYESGYGDALALGSTDLSGSLTDNVFDGEILLTNGQVNGVDPRDARSQNFVVPDNQPFVNGRGRIAFTGNRIHRLYMWIPRSQVFDNLVAGTIPGYESVTLTSNQLHDCGNSIYGEVTIVNGNQVEHGTVPTGVRLGITLSQRTAYTANVSTLSGEEAPSWRAVSRFRSVTGNLMNVVPG
ncbi:hypothetical protein GCM10027296_24200 [Chitinimonas naiadis]